MQGYPRVSMGREFTGEAFAAGTQDLRLAHEAAAGERDLAMGADCKVRGREALKFHPWDRPCRPG